MKNSIASLSMGTIVLRSRVLQLTVLVAALIVLWLGVSWRMGWFPFRTYQLTKEELFAKMVEAGTANGPATDLSPAMTKAGTAIQTTSSAKVSASTTKLMEAAGTAR